MTKVQAVDPASLMPGLYIVATPIGNLRDITLRAIDILNQVDLVLAEDTRTSQKLLNAHGIRAELRPYHDHNGANVRPGILNALSDGQRIALISDAGTPLVSDPGYKLVREAVDAGVEVFPVPGASAPLAALSVSGLPSDRFLFSGFLPPKSAARQKALESLKTVPATLIFFETGPRLAAMLSDMKAVLGDRSTVVARELTKLHEEVQRGSLSDLIPFYQTPPKGEIVVLVSGETQETSASESDIDTALTEALETLRTKDAANLVADRFGLKRKDTYARALELSGKGS